MTIPRFYVPGPWTSDRITFPEKASHHAMRVLRMRHGDEAEVFDGEGRTVRGRTEFSSEGTVLIAESYPEHGRESPLFITLAQAFVSPDKMEWITEKAVEAGASRIVFFPAARSVTKLSGDKLTKRLEKLRATAVSACEQCGRSRIPEIETFASAEAMLSGLNADARVILAPSSDPGLALGAARSVVFAVGPEGGFSEEELTLADGAGWTRGLLGPRVLRTETAGLVAIACANAVSGDYDITGSRA